MFQPDLLQGRRILITGGGSGLGFSMARRFAQLGAELVLCGRRQDVLDTACEQIRAESGTRVQGMTLDVRDAAAVEATMARVWEDGPLYGVVNNAAGNFIARSETLSPRAFDTVLQIVLHGTAYCSLAAGKRWIEAGQQGVILSIITTAAWTGAAFTAPSAAAKAGVLGLMRSLASEWGPKGIRTAAIAPGHFPTPGAWDRLYPEGTLPEPLENDVSLRRFGEHDELGNLASYLISPQAAYITGECVVIDGGRWFDGNGSAFNRRLSGWSDAQWAAFRSGAPAHEAKPAGGGGGQ